MPAKIVVQNVFSRIYGELPSHLEQAISKELSYCVLNQEHIVKSLAERDLAASNWDGRIELFWPSKGNCFYTGMMSDVLYILDSAGFKYIIDDRRIVPVRNLTDKMKFILPPGKFERPYQNIVMASLYKSGRGILQAATGSGKTFMICKLIGSIKTGPFLFFVPSVDIMDQAYECLSDCLTVPIGRIGDGIFDIQQINVVMIQTAVKAIKRHDPNFKVSDYRFDEEDSWDSSPVEEDKAKAIDNLIRSAAGVYVDECVDGTTKIITDKGIIPISLVKTSGCSRVLTYGGFSEITGWKNKGKRRTILVTLSNGKAIRCTPDHPIGTLRGWTRADKLNLQDEILCVDTVVKHGSSQSIWHTSWATVTKITDIQETDVYDISVKNACAFFGNNIYVHNCHHAASKSCQTIMEACTSAYYRYGGSATPFREDGAEKMIKALFGKVIQKVSASWLIRNKYLVKPYIFNVRMSGMHGDWKSYPQVYKNYIVENDDLHKLVAKITLRMHQLGVPTLILVQQYKHGNTLHKILPDVPFIRGDMPRKKRRETIASLRDGSLPCAIATTLADEGLDVERLGCAVIAGGGKSCTRVYQRVGRVIRSFSENGIVKDKAVVFLFHHEVPILDRHGRRVASILREEPEFKIINTTYDRVMDDVNSLFCPDSVGIFD